MSTHSFDQIQIFFADRSTSPFTIQAIKDSQYPYTPLLPYLPTQTAFLHQTHSIGGLTFVNPAQIQQFKNLSQTGDYLISTVAGSAIGILTADCLPVIFYAPDLKIVAAVHAGWRGSVAGILQRTMTDLRVLGINKSQLRVWFGPAAGVCCYEVTSEFQDRFYQQNILAVANLDRCFETRNSRLYFNLPRYNYELLLLDDILSHNVDLKYNLCTICNLQYCSYRRDGFASGLQVSRVVLKP